MWNKSLRLLMVRVKVTRRRGFSYPVPIWVVGEFMDALTDLAWVGEKVISHVPLPQETKARQQLSWLRAWSPSGLMIVAHNLIKDLSGYKGLDIVDVQVGEIQVKISIK